MKAIRDFYHQQQFYWVGTALKGRMLIDTRHYDTKHALHEARTR